MKMTCSGTINVACHKTAATSLHLEYWFGQVDSRPLSLFRICFGALLLKNALYFIPLAHLFYSDEGIVPRAQFWHDPAQVGLGQFSILNFMAASWMVTLVYLVWAGIALALVIGYRTRLMAVLNYALWLSVIHRNPFILHAPDQVMTVLSFWMIFLPLNHHYAVDGWLARRHSPAVESWGNCSTPCTTYAFPVRVIQLQVALIYTLTSYYKWHGLFWQNGEALSYTLQQESFLLPTGIWLGAIAPLWLLQLLTWSTLLTEAAFAPLVFAPVLQPWAKAIGLALAALLHLGIAVTMAIPDFSLVMWISYLLFFEPSWVVWLERQVRRLWKLPPLPLRTMAQPVSQSEGSNAFLAVRQATLTIVLTVILAVTIWGSFGSATDVWSKITPPQPPFVQAINRQLHLAAPWSMFAYLTVPRIGGLIIEGTFESVGKGLLYTSADPASGRLNWRVGPGARLRFFEQRLLWAFPETILQAWGGYYCQRYNRERAPGMRLAVVEFHRRYRWLQRMQTPSTFAGQDLLWRYQCFK